MFVFRDQAKKLFIELVPFYFLKQKKEGVGKRLLNFSSKKLHPLGTASKKNKKGLASVILATNSPNSELVITILIEEVVFVNKKVKKSKIFSYFKTSALVLFEIDVLFEALLLILDV